MGTTIFGKEYKDILRLAFPIILSQAGQVFVQLIDNAMVGRLGALPLASVSFAGSVFYMILVLAMGLTFGLTPIVGEAYSQRNYRKTAYYLQNSLLLFIGIGTALTILSFAIIPLMHHLGQPEEVVEMALPYYKYIAWSLVPFMIFAAFKQFLEGIGNTKVAMVVIITSNVINVIFNWLLIYGNWGFPAMGAGGAGLATLISRILTPILIISYFYKRDSFNRYFSFFSKDIFSFKRIKSLLKMGWPIAFQMFLEGSSFVMVGIMMGWVGTIEIASNQIAIIISNFAFMILLSISTSATICVSHAYGRKDFAEIKRYSSAAYRLGLIWNIITAILFFTFRYQIAALFTSDPDVIEMASHFLLFVAIYQISDGLQANSMGILRGLQDVKSITIIVFISYILISMPLGFVLAFRTSLGASGLWIGLILGLTIAAILLNARYRKQVRANLLKM